MESPEGEGGWLVREMERRLHCLQCSEEDRGMEKGRRVRKVGKETRTMPGLMG